MNIFRLRFGDTPVHTRTLQSLPTFYEIIHFPPGIFEQRGYIFEVFDETDAGASPNRLPDFAWAAPGMLAVSAKLENIVTWLKTKGCRVAEIVVQNQKYGFLVIPENSIDCIDFNNSKFDRFAKSGKIKRMLEWKLDAARVSLNWPLFRLNLEGDPSVEIFATAEFKTAYETVGATGLQFVQITP